MKISPHFQAAGRNPIDHRAIPEHRQIEAVSVKGDELWKQLTNLFDKIAYQLCLGSLANVGCAERVHPPAFRLARRDQGAYARDLMKRVFRETRTKCFPDL